MKIDAYPSQLLDPGERVIWSGRPSAPSYAVTKSTGTFLFGVLFFGFAVYWVNMVYRKAGLEALFGVPFVIIGLGLVLSPLWHFIRGQRTTYVLTDRRAIIDIAGFFPKRLSVLLNQMRFVELKASSKGAGDIVFREFAVSAGEGHSITRDGFIAIADAASVDRLLRTEIAKLRNTSATSV